LKYQGGEFFVSQFGGGYSTHTKSNWQQVVLVTPTLLRNWGFQPVLLLQELKDFVMPLKPLSFFLCQVVIETFGLFAYSLKLSAGCWEAFYDLW